MAVTSALRRHKLAHLSAACWQEILAVQRDAVEANCLRHWSERALPLVVTCQPDLGQHAPVPVALGLAAPLVWQRRRIAVQVAPSQIVRFAEFPTLAQATQELERSKQPELLALHRRLRNMGVRAHVYGSAGWQHLTKLRYMRENSDLDLWVMVHDACQADLVVRALQASRTAIRIDGEIVFSGGDAVAWREWAAWRDGRCQSVLMKRLNGPVMVGPRLGPTTPCAA